MGRGKEALVVCSDRNLGIGITIWDMGTGKRITRIPTCASSPRGMLCVRGRFLMASQTNRLGSVGRGAIFTWPLNKTRSPLRSYPLEAIGPLSCTNDGVYLAGGAPSGNAYIWEITSGKLLKTWRAHHKAVKCMVFSEDGSLLISGSDDGMVCVWSMVSLLDVEDPGNSSSLLHYSLEHTSSITGLLTTSGSTNSIFISSSLDGTCKAWDPVLGKLIQTQVYPQAITAITFHPVEKFLFAGSLDGSIFVSTLDVGLVEGPFTVADQPVVLKRHNGSITSLTFSQSGLVSASEDCSVCLWDVNSWTLTRRFIHKKGAVTNAVVILRSSLCPVSSKRRTSNQLRVSLLEKCPQPANLSKGVMTSLLPSCSSLRNNQTSIDFQITNSLDQQLLDLRQQTHAAMQMKVEMSIDDRKWAIEMAKHVMELNRHLQSCLLDLMRCRLSRTQCDSSATKKRKRIKV